MTKNELVGLVLSNPFIVKLARSGYQDKEGNWHPTIPQDELRTAVSNYIEMAIDYTSSRYQFDFVCAQYDYPGGTVADTDLYILEGEHQNARAILDIRYDTGMTLLRKYRQVDLDRALSGGVTQNSVVAWIERGLVNGFPQIQLIGTPATSGVTIRYRYLRGKITVDEWPEQFVYVLLSRTIAYLVPEYGPKADDDLQAMMATYGAGGGGYDPVPLDTEIVSANLQRNVRIGYRNGYYNPGTGQ